ncbi:MAG: peptidoglycan-binding protein [Hyphomonas sp.]
MANIISISGVGDIDLDKIAGLLPGRNSWDVLRLGTQGRYIRAIVDSFDTLGRYEINTPLRLAHFLGQGLVETGWLRFTTESLNYSAERLPKIFSFYRQNPALARQHAHRQELIANTVYGPQTALGQRLGNTQPGDGWKFRGRGFIQLTGRDNYTRYGNAAGLDLANDPDIISKDLTKSIEVAAAFWKTNGLNRWADENDAAKVSRGVNRGNPLSTVAAHDEDVRVLWTNIALGVTGSPETVAPDAAPSAPSLKPLAVGSRGDRVKQLQTDLETLGFATGGVDGIFGQGTRRAVVTFQQERGLPVTGIADTATLDAVKQATEEPVHSRIDRSDPRIFG